MRELFESTDVPSFLDEVAKRFLHEARRTYAAHNLKTEIVINQQYPLILTWLGDSANEALACLLQSRGLIATSNELGVEIRGSPQSTDSIIAILKNISINEIPPLDQLLKNALNLRKEKWDWAVPDTLLRKSYASQYLAVDEALAWISQI